MCGELFVFKESEMENRNKEVECTVVLRLVSDGSVNGTRIETSDGKRVSGVERIGWELDSGYPGYAHVTLTFLAARVKLSGEIPSFPKSKKIKG